MKTVRVSNLSRGVALGNHIAVAASFLQRAVGLIGSRVLPPGGGLWISPCNSVHTFFMNYPIDLLFLDDHNVIVDARTVRPWRLVPWVAYSRGVLELPAGTISRTGTQKGHRVQIMETP